MMFDSLHKNPKIQLILGLFMGIAFGFLLQTGGVTDYNIILGQLLLTDFTVVKVMLAAVLVGMPGIYLMKEWGWVTLHVRSGTIGSNVIGGLIFGLGFGTLGYCPGTVAGAVGQGALDALVGGVPGILLGTGLFAALYPVLQEKILEKGPFPADTFPELLGVTPWMVVIPVAVFIVAIFVWLEYLGL
jgi:hypothetical protein